LGRIQLIDQLPAVSAVVKIDHSQRRILHDPILKYVSKGSRDENGNDQHQ
jgi:hypothetical protein